MARRELDWEKRLSKNIPVDRTGRPYFNAYAGPRHIYIEVGLRNDRYGGPVRCLRSMAEDARMPHEQDDHLVHGRYDTVHWPDWESGFQCLGESLAFLGEEEIPFEQWGELHISLPDDELPYDMSSPLLLPLDSFSNLRTLTWKGHRKQLIASWLPFTPTLLRTLTTLEIQCDLSLQDCCHMLFYGENLKEFTARIIQRDLSTEQMLGFVPPEASYTTRPLEYLCLVSDDDITPLFRPFNFPALRRIDFTLAHPAWALFPPKTDVGSSASVLLQSKAVLYRSRSISQERQVL
ncbi:hypothetical protein H0H93_000933 [Arthromyces matolae]|nr:hypothetical protein H0H93_000933 [Arthromyces matolae]